MSENPFDAADADRHAIWELLVRRDSEFFLTSDWSLVADDYIEDGFVGIDAGRQLDPAAWRVGFGALADYRRAAEEGRFNPAEFADDLRDAWFECQSLAKIEIKGAIALAHKHIDGRIARRDGTALELHWRSVFFLRMVEGRWKITGFVGYLPLG